MTMSEELLSELTNFFIPVGREDIDRRSEPSVRNARPPASCSTGSWTGFTSLTSGPLLQPDFARNFSHLGIDAVLHYSRMSTAMN